MADFWETIMTGIGDIMNVPEFSYQQSRKMFPEQSWDDSQLDAARHLLFMGRLGQLTNPTVAKMAGLFHEGTGLLGGLLGGNLPEAWNSTKQDLINNEIALRQLAPQAKTPEALIGMVEQLMKQSKQVKPEELSLFKEYYQPQYYHK